ncbi:MAG: T9SS type A sorting domain-containing protein [Ignavibacteria bacterium]|nr:T9SS type A sorting domain-containing protein [Ignavibacteria bacterium]MCU7499657.1 T9SS type A sorting domain-containing protein [Ignavibacteria bacterium]MCU7512902.1 T9SS type A sorting domain-containing protein [Ignavibacteria bacterium]MCU7521420.1 T9SS type A sorting domain-containing protein [Ignavibacteria bacterium]MCU7526393.1 T9SS type A sorting domain-containing protein [Ignavibacteria bacterium]
MRTKQIKFLKVLSVIIILSSYCYAQQWVSFSAEAEITCQTIEGQYLWVGTQKYLSKLNTQTGEVVDIHMTFARRSFADQYNRITSIAVDEHGDKWMGTMGSGLAKFDGQNWTVYNKINSRIIDRNVISIAVDQLDNKWIGTYKGLDVFREDGVILTDVKKDNASLPESFSLSQNYPNPFNPSTTINYSIPESRMVTLKVYDMLGKEVSTLLNEYKTAGNHSVQFNASSLPSGIYIYTIQAGAFRDSKKLMLLK